MSGPATSTQLPEDEVPFPGGLIEVLTPGLQTSVQDLGRPGHAHLGVSASGAADPVSLRLGNWLVGNPPDAAALEMTLIGGTFRFPAEAVVALAGSDPGATLDGQPLPPWRSVRVRAGQTLACGPLRGGARCLLCVRGGIAVPAVLDSRSTHLTSGLGGFQGRALRAGDALPIGGEQTPECGERALPEGEVTGLLRRDVLRVVPGAQWEWFSSAARKELLTSPFTVTERSNRMGLRLSGRPLTAVDRTRMLTEGISLGTLQVPGDGQPILSFVEHQTTGGYPQIACVIAADLHRAAHLLPRDEVRFELVSLAGADSARRELEASVARWLERG